MDPDRTGCIVNAHSLMLDQIHCTIYPDPVQKLTRRHTGNIPEYAAEVPGRDIVSGGKFSHIPIKIKTIFEIADDISDYFFLPVSGTAVLD